MAVNQVNLANGEELINLTEDTVSEDTLLEGETAHDASGNQITGKFVPYNPNLLDNWYFAEPINQRGRTEYTGRGYTIDRWFKNVANTVRIIDNGVQLVESGSLIRQIITTDLRDFLIGKEVTLTALLSSGNLITASTVFPDKAGASLESQGNVAMSLYWDGEYQNVVFTAQEVSATIEAAKLELGSQQTLARKDAEGNWVLNDPPPNPATELAKCQRYFYRVGLGTGNVHHGVGISSSTGRCLVTMPTPVTMRINPTVTITGNAYLANGKATNVPVKGIAASFKTGANASDIQLYVDTESGALVVGDAYLLRTESSFIDFSAEL